MALNDANVDEEMASDWAAIQDKFKAPEPEAPPELEAETSETSPEESSETIPVSREADGKFKAHEREKPAKVDAKAKPAKDAKATPAAASPDRAAPSQEGSEAATAEPQSQQRDITRAPSTWRPLARAEYDKLPAAVKAEIHRREGDFLNGQAQMRPDADMGRELRGIMEPYRMLIEAEGGTYALAVRDLFRTAAVLRTGSMQQKQQLIAQTARQFGIDLSPFAQAGQPGQQPQPPAAQGANPQQYRDSRLDAFLAEQQRREQATLAREQQEIEGTVTQWMNATDAQGQPLRPYLNDVINEAAALVPQLMAANPGMSRVQALDAAYDRACWAHPEIRTLLAQKQQAELDAKRKADNQLKLRDARRSGSVNVPRRASTPSAPPPGTMEETIAETARALGMIS
jgi:hypothetical protein